MISIKIDEMEGREQCCGCEACANICPKRCITMTEDSEGFCYPVLDEEFCIDCSLCEKVCPILMQKKEASNNNCEEKHIQDRYTLPDAYAVMNRDEDVRLVSSSGGMFSLLAESVLAQAGYVFGAVMSDDCRTVYHREIGTVEDLDKLRGSKYVQSRIGDTYQQVKKRLEAGTLVLFSGTPCQIEGLQSYLDREYKNLVCIDFICHGVPSPKVWKTYVDFRLRREKEEFVQQTFFRHKIYGWKMYALLFEYSNNKAYIGKLGKDPYLKAFLNDAILRPSCYNCKFKKINHKSDITLADFWGIQNVAPEMDDDKGTSLVIVHSNKGKKIFESLSSKMISKKVDVSVAIKYNPSMLCSVNPHEKREKFFVKLETMPFDQLVKQYTKKKRTWKSVVLACLNRLGLYGIAVKWYMRLKKYS